MIQSQDYSIRRLFNKKINFDFNKEGNYDIKCFLKFLLFLCLLIILYLYNKLSLVFNF